MAGSRSQLEGVNWLWYNWHKHINCILADEMGLGKTVQVLGLLAWLRGAAKVRRWSQQRLGTYGDTNDVWSLCVWLRFAARRARCLSSLRSARWTTGSARPCGGRRTCTPSSFTARSRTARSFKGTAARIACTAPCAAAH